MIGGKKEPSGITSPTRFPSCLNDGAHGEQGRNQGDRQLQWEMNAQTWRTVKGTRRYNQRRFKDGLESPVRCSWRSSSKIDGDIRIIRFSRIQSYVPNLASPHGSTLCDIDQSQPPMPRRGFPRVAFY